VRREVQTAYNTKIQSKLQGTAWTSGCASWYVDATGKVTTVWPGATWRYRRATGRFDAENYELESARTRPVPVQVTPIP
jgi:cyclohexanone monooxygenase